MSEVYLLRGDFDNVVALKSDNMSATTARNVVHLRCKAIF